MLTIRIQEEDGHEQVQEARGISALPDTKGNVESIVCYLPNGHSFQVDRGDVFVMNDNGKTIADYHLHPDKERA